MELHLPPMPTLEMFDFGDYIFSAEYAAALEAWERVCNRLIKAAPQG